MKMNKSAKNMEHNLVKKYNLKEARITLTPCDELTQNAPTQPENVQVDVNSQQNIHNGMVYLTSDCLSGDFVNIFYPNQEGSTNDRTNGLNLLIASELINGDGTIIVQQGEYLTTDCIFLPVAEDQTIQVITSGEFSSDSTEKMRLEGVNMPGYLFCSDPTSSISLASESTLQNDVMLGQIAVGATKGADDDDLVGELRKFLPKQNESMNDMTNDITECGMDWHGGELDWNLEQSAMNEGMQISETEKLNEEFSRRMREEFAASFINKNSLSELKKKIGNLKCPGKKDIGSEEVKEINPNEEKRKKQDNKEEEVCVNQTTTYHMEEEVCADRTTTHHMEEGVCADRTTTHHMEEDFYVYRTTTYHKRRLSTGSDSSCKKIKKDVSNDNKLKVVSSKERRKEQEREQVSSKSKKVEHESKRCNGVKEKQEVNKTRQKTKGRMGKETCRGRRCQKGPQVGSVYCSMECIKIHVEHSLQLLHGKQLENVTERVVVLDRKSGKLLTGPLAPTVSNLLVWIQKHPSFEVLQPKHIPTPQRASRKSSVAEESLKKKPRKGLSFARTSPSTSQKKVCQKTCFDSQRIAIRRNIQQILLSKMNESVMMTASEVKHLSIDLENKLFSHHKSVDVFYRQHYQGLSKLLRHSAHEILNGEETLDDFMERALLKDDDILSTDGSTLKHDQHFYDINCQICNPIVTDNKKHVRTEDRHRLPLGKVLSPDVSSTTDVDIYVDNSRVLTLIDTETPVLKQMNLCDYKPSSSSSFITKNTIPDVPIDRVWSGHLTMRDLANFSVSAFRTSGSMKLIRKNFPSILTIMGRIAESVVEDYVRMIKTTYSSTKEVAVICFNFDKEEGQREGYKTLFEYLHSRQRCGVVGPIGSTIKDVYVWPLPSSQDIPSFLTPFIGPGLDVNREDLLLGIIVQQCPNPQSTHASSLTASYTIGSIKKSQKDKNINDDDDDEGEEEDDDLEHDIIAGNIGDNYKINLKPENNKDENKMDDVVGQLTDTEELSLSSMSIITTENSIRKGDDDQPYEPLDSSQEENASQEPLHESGEIQKKFDSLIEILNRKPGVPSSSSLSSSGKVTSQQLSSNSSTTDELSQNSLETPNCEAATAALISLNVFLEKFIAQKKSQPVEPNDTFGKSLPNFKLCEITNEQHQLMKQVLKIVKAKSNNDGSADHDFHPVSNQLPENEDSNSTVTNAKYSLLNENLKSRMNWQERPVQTEAPLPSSQVGLETDIITNPPANVSYDYHTSPMHRNPGDFWATSQDFCKHPSGFNPTRITYGHQRRNYPLRHEGNREMSYPASYQSSGHYHGNLPFPGRYKPERFNRFDESKSMHNNFQGWWRGRGR